MMTARETTTNIRASLKEKEAWEPLARAAGFIRHQAGVEVGNVSAWLRHLGNREVEKRKVERTAGGKR